MEVGAEVVETKEEDEEEEEKKEKEDNKIEIVEKNPLLPRLVKVCYCYSEACKRGTLCGHVFLFFKKGFIRKSAIW